MIGLPAARATAPHLFPECLGNRTSGMWARPLAAFSRARTVESTGILSLTQSRWRPSVHWRWRRAVRTAIGRELVHLLSARPYRQDNGSTNRAPPRQPAPWWDW